MKNANRWILLLLVLAAPLLYAQDVQELYEQAKEALKSADYQTCLDKVAAAKAEISQDAKLDPNGVFMKRLLPEVETNGQNMASIMLALEELFENSQSGVTFADLGLTQEAVNSYFEQARDASDELQRKRDEILASRDLAPEYKTALLRAPILARIEKLASTGIMEKLTARFSQMVGVLTDSLAAVDNRYRMAEARLAKVQKSAAASRQEIEKIKGEMAKLNAERLSYINTISEMLAGEASAEMEPIRVALSENQVDDVFRGVIESEIRRVKGITLIDSVGYKELLKDYDRIRNYNRIFAKNSIAPDQAALLASYEAAIKAVPVEEPKRTNWTMIYIIAGVFLVLLLITLYKLSSGSKKEKPPTSFESYKP
jgi:predicted transcriptional regulator